MSTGPAGASTPAVGECATTSPQAREYLAYGLRFRSEIELPFLSAAGEGEPDVVVRLGAAPEAAALDLRRGIWKSASDRFMLNVDAVARYVVREGREIVVERAGGDDAAVRAFLLGSVLAACLQQRRILTLHASAIATGTGAVLFLGGSGSGKSTLAAALVERGYPLLADDVTGVVVDAGGRPTALSAFPCLRLWADAVERLAWQERTRGKVRDALDKHVTAVARFRRSPLFVRAAFVLASHNRNGFEIEPAPDTAAFETLIRYTFRKRYVRGPDLRREHFRIASALARHAPVTRVTRPAHPFLLEALADEVEQRLQAGADAARAPAGARGGRRRTRQGN